MIFQLLCLSSFSFSSSSIRSPFFSSKISFFRLQFVTPHVSGSRCVECGPDEYVESPVVFLRRCTLGHAYLTPGKKRRRYDVEYPPERVQKAIHLIRNPMHNVIARFHLERRHKEYKNRTDYLETHPNDEVGLHAWCNDMKANYSAQDKEFFTNGIPTAPCHGEFYKWTQWHNLVHQSLDLIPHKVPILTGTCICIPFVSSFPFVSSYVIIVLNEDLKQPSQTLFLKLHSLSFYLFVGR
jgi:hypothetical protein